jgi:diadenosine tetraphosphate (Ap4A) HIT family hydrolase
MRAARAEESTHMTTEDCIFCRRGLPTPGVVHTDDNWYAAHAPATSSSPGTILLTTNRHVLDYADMTPDELDTLNPLLARLQRVIRDVTGADRVYFTSTATSVPHFHSYLTPYTTGGATFGPAWLAEKRESTPEAAAEAASAIAAALTAA